MTKNEQSLFDMHEFLDVFFDLFVPNSALHFLCQKVKPFLFGILELYFVVFFELLQVLFNNFAQLSRLQVIFPQNALQLLSLFKRNLFCLSCDSQFGVGIICYS